MTTVWEFTAMYAFWAFVVMMAVTRKIKKVKREFRQDVQKALYQDRQIRRGNVGSIDGSNSGRGSGASGR